MGGGRVAGSQAGRPLQSRPRGAVGSGGAAGLLSRPRIRSSRGRAVRVRCGGVGWVGCEFRDAMCDPCCAPCVPVCLPCCPDSRVRVCLSRPPGVEFTTNTRAHPDRAPRVNGRYVTCTVRRTCSRKVPNRKFLKGLASGMPIPLGPSCDQTKRVCWLKPAIIEIKGWTCQSLFRSLLRVTFSDLC